MFQHEARVWPGKYCQSMGLPPIKYSDTLLIRPKLLTGRVTLSRKPIKSHFGLYFVDCNEM